MNYTTQLTTIEQLYNSSKPLPGGNDVQHYPEGDWSIPGAEWMGFIKSIHPGSNDNAGVRFHNRRETHYYTWRTYAEKKE